MASAPAATLLLAAIVGISLIGFYVYPPLIERSLLRPHWLLPRREFGRLVSCGFVHANLTHLLFNAFTFWAFAFSLERRIGSGSFVALYAAGLLAGDLGTWIKHRDDPGYRTLGASGAILAVLFASIVYFPQASLFILPLPVPIPAPLFALGYLGFTLYAARRGGGRINHDAHLSGAIAGVLFVALTDVDALRRALRLLLG